MEVEFTQWTVVGLILGSAGSYMKRVGGQDYTRCVTGLWVDCYYSINNFEFSA